MKQFTDKLACAAWVIAVLTGWTSSAATLYVWPDSPNPVLPYDSWGNAATNIQDAVDAANPGDTVLVTNGVYASGTVEAQGTNRIALTGLMVVRSVNGPEVTVIEGAPGIRCAYVGFNTILSGFTLTNGNAGAGGGAWCEYSAVLTNCILTGNSATGTSGGGEGGGAYGGTLYNCTLSGNMANYYGLGYSEGGGSYESTLYNCTLSGNSAGYGGGASGGTLNNCTLSGNSARYGGGGASEGEFGCTLYNCIVTGNSATYGGGGGAGGGLLYNCTVTDNSGVGVSGGTLYNCIVYFNSGANYSGSTFNYSCTTPLPPEGTNNITANPQLASLTHLSVSSPCIGAGNSAYATGVDIDGEPWANPPCMGADQLTPGQATGSLTMSIEAEYTNVATEFAVRFGAQNQGHILTSVWDFDDGTFLTNQAIASHAWSAPGSYTVRLTGYNDSFPGGVTTTIQIEVSDTVYYVNQTNPTPVFPYTSWATAATNIQDGIDAGAPAGRLILVTNGVYASGSVAQGARIALTGPMVVRSVNGPEVTVIEGTAAPGSGNGNGAVRCAYLGTSAILSGFTLTNGHTWTYGAGGGAWCEDSAILTNCIITGNLADYEGGGTWAGTLNNCTLSGNSAGYGGGADGGTLNNCTLTGNSALAVGGGVYYGTLNNCTLSGNSAVGHGGGAAGGTLNNCIVYHNFAVDNPNYIACTFNYSCTTPLPAGPGNIDSDPLLASSSHLSPQSPCIGQGSSAYASGVDIDGEPWADPPCMGADQLTPGQATGPLSMAIRAEYTRMVPGFAVNFTADNQGPILASVWGFGDGTLLTNQPLTSHSWSAQGSYTVQLTGYNDSFPNGVTTTLEVEVTNQVHFVNQANPTPLFPYTSWETAATNIQDAIETRTGGGLVLVADGVYASGSVEMEGSNRIALTYPVQVRSVNGPGVTVVAGAAGIRCAYVGAEASLSGFTLTDGNNAEPGGGAWCEYSAVLTNCVVTGNSAYDGGGAYGGTLNHCTLSGNSASDDGGGAYGGTLNHCTLSGNSAYYGGGGANSSTLNHCTLSGNSAWQGGGAFFSTLHDCTLSGNSASYGGGAFGGTLYNCTLTGNSATGDYGEGGASSGGTLYNCTLTGNSAQDGGGVYWSKLYNCIVYFNSAPYGPNYTTNSFQATNFHYSCTTPLPTNGEGNITSAPIFVDQLGGNLRLQSNSPCINAGNNAYVTSATDLDGNPRIVGGTVDMGAYEDTDGATINGVPWIWLLQYGLPTDGSADAVDSDADGHTTFQEWVADTDPTNVLSYFHIEEISKSSPAMISFQSSSNRIYTLWGAPQLAPLDWTPVPGEQGIPGTGGTLTLSDPTNAPQRFYRVQVNLP